MVFNLAILLSSLISFLVYAVTFKIDVGMENKQNALVVIVILIALAVIGVIGSST